MYLTRNPEHSITPQDPEQARLLAPHTVGSVYDAIAHFAEQSGQTLTAEQTAAIVTRIEAWLESRDQEFLEQVGHVLEQILEK